MVLKEPAFQTAGRRFADLRQNELAGDNVSDSRNQRSKLESVRKRSVKQDYVAVAIQDIDVHGSMSPRSVRISQGDPRLRIRVWIAGRYGIDNELHGFPDKGLQSFAIHHVLGSHGRIAVVDYLLGQMRFIEIESGEQQ